MHFQQEPECVRAASCSCSGDQFRAFLHQEQAVGGPEKERLAAETGGVGDSKVGPTVHREHHTQVQADAPETGKASSRVDGCGPLLAARGRFLPTEGAAVETASHSAGRGTQAACLLFLQMMEIRT